MALPSPNTGSKEKRRYTRQATLRVARVRLDDGEAIAAEIRDYCQTGLYIAFLGEGTPDAAIPAMVGTLVQVEFGGKNGSRFRFKGRVARVSPNGIGVLVHVMPEGALQALQVDVPNPKPVTSKVQPVLSQEPGQLQPLKLECIHIFRSFLDTAIQDFFQLAQEQLYKEGQEQLGFLDRSSFEYGAQELTQHRSSIEKTFFNAIHDHIQNNDLVSESASVTTSKLAGNDLSLVNEDEFEDWLSLSAVIRQVERGIAIELEEFEQRYSRLVGVPIVRKSNPFGPEGIGRAFQVAIQVLDFTNPVRAVLYKVLGQAISNRNSDLYQQLNQSLISLKIDKPVRQRPHADSMPASATESADPGPEMGGPSPNLADITELLNDFFRHNQTNPSLPSDSTEYSLDHILAALNQSQQRMAGAATAPSTAPSRQKSSVPAGQVAVRPEMLQVVQQLQQSARKLVGQEAQLLSPVGSHMDRGSTRAEASLGELTTTLDKLPQLIQAAAGTPARPTLTDQIEASMSAAGGGSRYLTPQHRQILDTTSGLFARAWVDLVPSSDLEMLVKRLEHPLLKLALQDTEFPSLPNHPARQVLNLIEQFAVAADDSGKFFDAKLQRFLFLLVDRVCKRADVDLSIFATVRDNLEKVLLPILQIRRKRIARLQEACEGRERIRSARAQVNAALEQRLAGREVPSMLLRLLDAGWRQYMILLQMRQGAQGEAWDASLAVLDQLFDRLGPAQESNQRTPAGSGALLATIERMLETVNVDSNLLAAFMDELGECLITYSDPSAPGQAMVLVPLGRLAALAGENADHHPITPQWMKQLRVGDWWDLSMEGRKVSMQLIWSSQLTSTCAFANRSATNKLELTLPELSRQIQSGLAKPGKDMDLPVIERSENALFDETYQDLLHQVQHEPTTGLLNRKGFMQHLSLLGMPEHDDKTHAVGIIEFDQFRMIYNTCGVEAVEALTRSLATAVREHVGSDAVLASFRDDTLAILLPNCSRTVGCEAINQLLNQVKDHHFQHKAQSYSIGFNLGITEFSPSKLSAEDAIRRADSACITAKSQGRNRMQIYEETNPQLLSEESLMDWAGRIDAYINGNGLYLRCQQVMPVGVDTPLLPYYEVLLGIEGADGLEINPMHFIPAVERLQRAHEIDIWVIRNVFDWIGLNQDKFASVGGLAINLSATSLSSPEVMRFLQEVLPACDFPTNKITFEITETAAISSYGAAQDFIREIRRYGCRFALDDFGSGFTSYAHLKNLRTDSLKIDGSFVKDMLNNPGDYAMVKSMNDIGHSLGLRTVAEYVESPMILHALREIGVDYAQGYAVHKPCRIDEMLRYESV
ncbi:MAG: DUF1631 family protein [Sulfuriferula multivorans]|uniref:DUF1631 family protein n=1 Tax=Sulfuriferula multivorans TaxID=1559896 RepID=A0A7C9P4L7_9PROT|nr:DUF1631 family protein [Sulfuriferula multivorans]